MSRQFSYRHKKTKQKTKKEKQNQIPLYFLSKITKKQPNFLLLPFQIKRKPNKLPIKEVFRLLFLILLFHIAHKAFYQKESKSISFYKFAPE